MLTTTLPNPILPEFWGRPQDEIEADLAELRQRPISFHADVEMDEHDLLPQGKGAWVATRHHQIVEISKNPQTYSSAEGIMTLEEPPEFREFFSSMIAMDDPRHARLRRLVSAGFTPRMMERLQASIEDQAAKIVDDICGRGRIDFVADVAARLPLRIICDLMAIPPAQVDVVLEHSNTLLGISDPEFQLEGLTTLEAVLVAGQALADLMTDVARAKEGGDGDDLTSIMVNAEVDGDRLSPSDIASFFILLVVAGNETTRNAISWGLHHLTANPDQRALWLADFDGLAATAVEEIVRVASPVSYMRRTVTHDVVLDGVELQTGDKILQFYLAANRDEAVFADPYRFDVRRDPNPHLGFGGPGPHFCLGAHLARREIHVLFRELFSRLPDIEATAEPDVLQSAFIHGVKRLPAAFTPTAPVR